MDIYYDHTCDSRTCIECSKILHRPTETGKYLLLTKDIQFPCFRIIGKKLEPVKKSYKINLRNEIDILTTDTITLDVKIPIEFGDYEIPKTSSLTFIRSLMFGDVPKNKAKMYIVIKSNEGCCQYVSDITTTFACGWLTLNGTFTPLYNMTKVCEFEYSICFDPIRLNDKKIICDETPVYYKTKYKGDACLFIKT